MKNLLSIVCFLFVSTIFAQESKFSVTLSYPYPFDSNFVGANYTGVVDLGAQYRFVEAGPVQIGASINGSYLVFPDNPAPQTDKINATFIQPRIFGELNLPGLDNFTPSLGVGYTFSTFKAKIDFQGADDLKETYGGINLNLGFYYDITDRFFTHLHYDFVKLSRDDVPESKENTNINQAKIGIGYRF